MVEAPLPAETLFIAAVGLAALPATGFVTATGTAITLPTITMRAEIKHRPTGRKVTHALAKDRGARNRHRFVEGALDNRRRSWQDDSRDELGGPLIGANNEKPRLRKQPGFSFVHLRELILPNPTASQRACGDYTQSQKPPTAMMLKAKAAYGDDDDSPSYTGLCSDFYVFKWALTLVEALQPTAGFLVSNDGDTSRAAGVLPPAPGRCHGDRLCGCLGEVHL